jgi:hypothetical protein
MNSSKNSRPLLTDDGEFAEPVVVAPLIISRTDHHIRTRIPFRSSNTALQFIAFIFYLAVLIRFLLAVPADARVPIGLLAILGAVVYAIISSALSATRRRLTLHNPRGRKFTNSEVFGIGCCIGIVFFGLSLFFPNSDYIRLIVLVSVVVFGIMLASEARKNRRLNR